MPCPSRATAREVEGWALGNRVDLELVGSTTPLSPVVGGFCLAVDQSSRAANCSLRSLARELLKTALHIVGVGGASSLAAQQLRRDSRLDV